MKRVLLGMALIAAFASLAYGQEQSASARKAIEANAKNFVAAFNRGDAAGVAEIYAVDAKLLPPNGPIVEGRQAIQTFWANAISAGLKIPSITPVDVVASGNLAVDRGTYASTVPAAGGGTTAEAGKYVVVWKRQGRSWKIAYDIWNSDKALP